MCAHFKIAVLGAFAMNLGCAQAQSSPPDKFYGGIEAGLAVVKDQTGTVTNLLTSNFGGSASASQDSSIYDYRVFGGYKLNENVNFELGYSQTSSLGLKFSGVSSGSVAYAGSASAKYAGFDYSLLVRPDVATGMNNLFFRLGGHSLKETSNGNFTAVGRTISVTENQSGTGLLFGLGYDIKITKKADLRLSLNRVNKIAGQSDNSATVYSAGVLTRF